MPAQMHWAATPEAAAPPAVGLTGRFWPLLIFVLASVSSLVQNEPAPYDFLLMFGMALYALSGPPIPSGLAWPALGIFLVLFGYAVGALFAPYQTEALLYIRTSTYLSVSLLFFATLIWRNPDRIIPPLMVGLVITSLIAACLGIAGYFNIIPAETYAIYGRATGSFKDPNVFGPSLIFPALYLVHRLTTRPLSEMLWSLPALVVLQIALFLSFSRGAWINFVIAAGIFLVLSYSKAEPQQRARLLRFTMLLAIVAAVAIAVALSLEEVRSLFLQRFQVAQNYDLEEGGRFDSMSGAVWLGLHYPLGVGPDQWPRINPIHLMPHNIYANVFVSGGLISLIGLLTLTVATLRIGFRAAKLPSTHSSILFAALGTFAGHAFEGIIIDSNHWRHLYIVAGIVWGLALVALANARPVYRAPLPRRF